ncbi:MAG: hypothetical protein ABSE16_13440 [Verrucomicrobiota bacterium]|jgi:hypothetical protein
MPKPTSLPDWEQVLSAASRLQQLLPDAVLVGRTASAIHAQHRFSQDADHVLPGLREHFDEILAQLESVSGWKTARVQRPVQILGSLDGIETGIHQLIRDQPLETTVVNYGGQAITVPTKEEILRIKGALILRRNATRDYLDFVALADQLGGEKTARALLDFDRLYPQANEESALQQLQIQLASPLPYDLEETRLTEYKNLAPKWQDWKTVKTACNHCATSVFDRVAALEQERAQKEQDGPKQG